MATLVFVLLAYIIGSVPSGLIIGKVFYHTDLRDYGSKNIGATNAYRVLGAVPGLASSRRTWVRDSWACISARRRAWPLGRTIRAVWCIS